MTAYQDRQKEKRAQAQDWFKKRYDPAADALAQIEAIDREMYTRAEDAEGDERQKALDEEARAKTAFDRRMKLQDDARERADRIAKAQAKADDDMRVRADQQALADKHKAEEEKIRAEEQRKADAERQKRAVAAAVGARAPGDLQPGAVMRPGGWRPGEEMADIERRAKAAGMDPDEFKAAIDEIEAESRGKAREAGRKDDVAEAGIDADQALAEQRRRKPTGPKPKTPDQIAADDRKRRIQELDIEKRERELSGEKPITKKPLPAEQQAKLARAQQGLKQISDVRSLKSEVGTGPLESRAKDLIGNVIENPQRTRFNAAVGRLAQTVGVLLEGGKLAEGDAKRYAKLLAGTPMDDEEFKAVLEDMERDLNDLVESETSAFGESFVVPDALKKTTRKPAATIDPESAALGIKVK